ncbi:hypothetical protein K488DRAFT_88577 [Vararia minispora EC-137]|uniref:Uncharacterized protein n=1 Tax=Vararia minispora EC-137 TaxID=1314806 RepID=A0ACB8QCQ3_9AGAM|nr:hypothetical protein K488DRAFT_88577 [Vararia minispora EC-137]
MSASDLNADIICEIFTLLAHTDTPNARTLGWIRATHVCRRWRAVGLHLSFLWAGIVCAIPRAVNVVLARARSSPLTFRCPDLLSYEDDRRLLHAASAHLHSIQVLANNPASHAWLALFPGKTLPRLHTLHLNLTVLHDDVPSCAPINAPVLLSATFYGGKFLHINAPSLRSLSLLDQRVDVLHLLTVLRQCPSIEELAISSRTQTSSGLYISDQDSIDQHTSIDLLNLRSFSLAASDPPCSVLMRKLFLAERAHVDIIIDGTDPGQELIDAALASLTRCARLPRLDTLVIKDDHSFLSLCLHPPSGYDQKHCVSGAKRRGLYVRIKRARESAEAYAAGIAHVTRNVIELDISDLCLHDTIIPIFRALPRVIAISSSFKALDNIRRTLAMNSALFPELSTIKLHMHTLHSSTSSVRAWAEVVSVFQDNIDRGRHPLRLVRSWFNAPPPCPNKEHTSVLSRLSALGAKVFDEVPSFAALADI